MARIAVIGAGPAGSASALALQAQGRHEVHVYEAGLQARARIGESLAPDAAPLLQRLGLYEDFLRQGHAPCHGSAAAWEHAELGHLDYLSNPHGPGWHLDRQSFEAWLAGHVTASGAHLHRQHRLQGALATPDGGQRLQLRTPSGMRCEHFDWVIDAGGLSAPVATRMGAGRRMLDELLCIHVQCELPADRFPKQSLIEACAYGWWYAARLPGGAVVVMLATDLTLLRTLNLDQSERWWRALYATRILGPLLHSARPRQPLQLNLAATSLLEPCIGPGWLAVGDAASSLDPICARGLYKALEQACRLATVFADDASDQALTDYQRDIEQNFARHLAVQNAAYQRQQRWPHSPFWQRRRARSTQEWLQPQQQRTRRPVPEPVRV